jgi:hypothetical protein
MQVLRLASGIDVARTARNLCGCFALDDRSFLHGDFGEGAGEEEQICWMQVPFDYTLRASLRPGFST